MEADGQMAVASAKIRNVVVVFVVVVVMGAPGLRVCELISMRRCLWDVVMKIQHISSLGSQACAKPYSMRSQSLKLPFSLASKSSSHRLSNSHCSPVNLLYDVVYHRPKRISAAIFRSSPS